MSVPDRPWWQVIVEVEHRHLDVVTDVLWMHEPAAVEEVEHGDGLRLIAGWPDESTARSAAGDLDRRFAEGGGKVVGVAVAVRPVLDDGLDAWRAHAAPIDTAAFRLIPAWLDSDGVPPGTDLLPLRIDPGRAFGSGSHPTTRLCLDALAGSDPSPTGATVLDVGAGSGVLGIAAAMIGAAEVLAIDIDPASPAVVSENASLNDVGAVVTASTDPLERVAGRRFDLVLANLLAPIIDDLADHLVGALAPGGKLIVSGILAERTGATEAVLSAAGAEVIERSEAEGWAVLVLTGRPARRARGTGTLPSHG